MKKGIAAVLALLLCLALLGSAMAESNLTEPGTFPLVKETVELSVYVHPSPDLKVDSYDARDGNIFAKYFEEKTNVRLNFIMAPSANEISTKLQLLIQSGETPDIMFVNGFSAAQTQLYGNQGILLEISDLVAQHAPRIQQMWDDKPDIRKAVTLAGGKIYAVNHYPYDPHGATWNKMWVYKPWLDKLNLEIPETTEDFYQALVAVKNASDLNGNGLDDEIPLIGNISWVAWDPTVYLMNAFIYNDYETNVHVNNGKVFAAFTKPEYRDGLAWIAKLYKEGLIAPETYTLNDFSIYKTLTNQKDNVVAFMPTHAPFTAVEEHWPDFVAVPPLTGPGGLKTCMKNQTILTPTGGALISADCKYPEVAIRVLDAMFDLDVQLHGIGEEGVAWRKAEPGEVNRKGEQAAYMDLTKGSTYDVTRDTPQNATWPMLMYFRDDYMDFLGTGKMMPREDLFAINPEQIDYKKPLEEATLASYIPYMPPVESLLPVNLVYEDDQAAEASDLWQLIDVTFRTWQMRFINGEADVETQWDAFQEELTNSGIDRYLEIVQEAYDAMK